MAASLEKDKSEEKKDKGFLEQLALSYKYCVLKHPILTKSVTSAVIAGLGNYVSQRIEKRGKNVPIEYRPVLAFSGYGFFISGPLIHYFYEYLEKFLPKSTSYGKAKRLLVDRGVMSPLLLFIFFYVVAIMEGKSHKQAMMKIRQHYWTALKMSWRVWILFQYFNLNYVPLQYRVLTGNVMSFLWSIYLASKRS